LAGTADKADRWLWYAARTGRCVPIDAAAYPSTIFNGTSTPLPAWVCKAPDGGLHVDHRLGRVDIDVAEPPTARIEINWTCDYGVRVLSRAWLSEIQDLIDESSIFVGEVRRGGRRLDDWATIHERTAPSLISSEGRGKICPICGHVFMTLWGRIYFADPSVVGRPLIVNGKGVFVREDLALSRELRRPLGAYKPSAVRFNRRAADQLSAKRSPT
jgi:hypothetical protein